MNVAEIVRELRNQRMKMVQSFSQYLLIYQCVAIILKEQGVPEQAFWRRFSKTRGRENSSTMGAPKTIRLGTHNFGVLGESPLKKRKDRSEPTMSDAIDMSSMGVKPMKISHGSGEPAICFEPDDSIS